MKMELSTSDKIIRHTCSVFFLCFCFGYLYFMQGELLAEAQYVFSHGITHYSILIGAIIITLVLWLMQWLIARFVSFPTRCFTLTYLPSFLVLAVLTGLSRQRVAEASFTPWHWLAPLILLLWVLFVYVMNRLTTSRGTGHKVSTADRNEQGIGRDLWPNYFIFLAMMLICGITNPADDVWHYELKAERLILEQRYEEAAQVGIEGEANSPRLNSLRHYALVRQDPSRLPDDIFLYPQPYGLEGLLQLSDTSRRLERLTATDITAWLGAHAVDTRMPLDRFLQLGLRLEQAHLDSLLAVDSLYLANASDSIRHQHAGAVGTLRRHVRATADYRLCALLLKKDLPQFLAEIPEYYPQVADTLDEVRASLPRAYRQALAIIRPEWTDSTTLHQYYSYAAMLDTLTTPRSRRNLTRYELGRNYWWYFDFQ